VRLAGAGEWPQKGARDAKQKIGSFPWVRLQPDVVAQAMLVDCVDVVRLKPDLRERRVHLAGAGEWPQKGARDAKQKI